MNYRKHIIRPAQHVKLSIDPMFASMNHSGQLRQKDIAGAENIF
ncbi:unnamed protein product, partial [marine sediment metagenome]